MMESLSVLKAPVLRYSLKSPLHSSVKIPSPRRLNTLIVDAKKDRRSGHSFTRRRKRPRKKYSPRPYEMPDISILYSNSNVVESSPDLVKGCNEHIDYFIEDRNLSEAQDLFNLMVDKRVEPDVYTYTTLMKGYSRVGNHEIVCKLFKEMEEKGVIPSVVTFDTAIRSYAIEGDLKGAQSFFNKMKNGYGLDPDAYTFSSMLTVCVSARDLETAKSLFQEMMLSGVEANNVLLSSMIDVYAECCNKESGKQYLEECRELMEDMKLKGIRADKQTYNILLKLCARGSLTADAMKILNEMIRNRIWPDVFSYSTVLDGISKDQNLSRKEVLELSTKIVKQMKREGIRPNATTFNSLISVSLRLEDLYRAKRLLKEMRTLKVEPTVVNYGSMIKCHEKLGDPEDGHSYLKPCLDLWHECEKAGLKLTEEGYTSLLSACAKVSNLDQALKFWNGMMEKKVESNVHIYTALIKACLNKDKEDKAFDFYDQMKASGIKPDVVTYGTFLSYFEKKKDRAGAEKICDEMKIHGVEPGKSILRIRKALGFT